MGVQLDRHHDSLGGDQPEELRRPQLPPGDLVCGNLVLVGVHHQRFVASLQILQQLFKAHELPTGCIVAVLAELDVAHRQNGHVAQVRLQLAVRLNQVLQALLAPSVLRRVEEEGRLRLGEVGLQQTLGHGHAQAGHGLIGVIESLVGADHRRGDEEGPRDGMRSRVAEPLHNLVQRIGGIGLVCPRRSGQEGFLQAEEENTQGPFVIQPGRGEDRRLHAGLFGHPGAAHPEGIRVHLQRSFAGLDLAFWWFGLVAFLLIHPRLHDPYQLHLPLNGPAGRHVGTGEDDSAVESSRVAPAIHQGHRYVQDFLAGIGVVLDSDAVLRRLHGGHVAPHTEHGDQGQVVFAAVQVTHLALFVVGPVQGLEGVAQVVGVRGDHLQVYVDWALVIAGVDAQGEGGSVAGQGGEGGEVRPVGDTVAIVVIVPHVGHAVQVGVEALVGPALQGSGPSRPADGIRPLQAVAQAVPVAVEVQGVGDPVLPVVVEAFNLQRVGDQVEVAVHRGGERAQHLLVGIGEAVLVRIFVAEPGRHVTVIVADAQLFAPFGRPRIQPRCLR